MSEVIGTAIDALTNFQRQLDPEGIEVGVSRQALEEVLAENSRLQSELEQARESARKIEWDRDGCMSALEREGHRAEKAEAERDELREALEEIREIYAGMDGFIPETAPEGYLQRIIEKMWAEVRDALTTHEQEKKDESE